MNVQFSQDSGSRPAEEIKSILLQSLIGTIGVMWILGGIVAIVNLYGMHWALGWLSGFIWVWGCWAAALYFDVRRFFS